MDLTFGPLLLEQISDALVVAELGRREISATAFVNSMPDVDIPIIAHKGDKSLALQARALRNGAACFDARQFVEIEAGPDGRECLALRDLGPDLIYVFVLIRRDGPHDRFFIITRDDLQAWIATRCQTLLRASGAGQQRHHDRLSVTITLADLAPYEAAWHGITDRL
jgi:hypothetical protein